MSAPDLNTLLIVAGSCGSGKSTVLRAAYQQNLPLFGVDEAETFASTNRDPSGTEFDDFSQALLRQSFFQASHLKRLNRAADLPANVLMHLDLYQILRGIDPSYWPRSLKKRALQLAAPDGVLGKRSLEHLQDSRENDLMLKAYLQRPFFSRFQRILVNTVLCDFETNALQLARRKQRSKQGRFKYFSAPEPLARAIHSEIYASWTRNLSQLRPVGLFTTMVSSSGDLTVNGAVVAQGWSNRFQRRP
ncbi:MAG: hypothetical protein ACPHGV_04735 [Synechococcus sp.]